MELSYSHALNQRVLRQRNLLAIVAAALAAVAALLAMLGLTRSREIVLQPVLRSPVTISSSGVSRDYLQMVTRDVVLLTLNRSPQNLDYWMNSVLAVTSLRSQGRVKADLLKIVDEQRGSSIEQFFTIQSMNVDPEHLTSEVSGDLHTMVGEKIVSTERRTFRYHWEYEGLSLRLVGFGIVRTGKEQDQ